MPLSYVFKRLVRSWQLYIALLLGIILASTFFAGINVGADTAAQQALEQSLSRISVDMTVEPSYFIQGYPGSTGGMSSKNVSDAIRSISNVPGVAKVEAISRYSNFDYREKINFTVTTDVLGIFEDSRIYQGLSDGTISALGANETYFWADSSDAAKVHVDDVLPINFTLFSWKPDGGNVTRLSFLLNLTVVGFVSLTEQAFSIAMGQYYGYVGFYPQPNLLITSWNKTFAKLLDTFYVFSPQGSPIYTTILVYLDRSSLISPWDIPASIGRLGAVTLQINERVSPYGLSARNNLADALNNYQSVSFGMRFSFIVAAIPVFFVAWYMGSTVSDVSFNLRRREIGLLLTKGFSRRQLFSMFLFESSLIGLFGGAIGILLSLTLSPWFVTAAGGQFSGTPVIGPDSIVLTLVFALIITFLSAYRPARRASNMATVDALREYMYVEEVKPYKRLWPWLALIFGCFKLIVLLLGINFQAEMIRLGFPPANILLFILLNIVIMIDGVLTFIGPFLFFWGFTKIFIRGSLKFQEVTARAARFLGDLGELATKSVQRNPARVAAVAFLIAFIIGYSVQIVGSLASEEDFQVRETYFTVGSDVSVQLSSPTNASQIMDTIRNNVSHIQSITAEYTFWRSAGLGTFDRGMQLRAVNPQAWLSTAYYENDFFSGNTVERAFEIMRSDNLTVILERNYATVLNKKVGDFIAVTFGEKKTQQLKVVGFFGIESPQTSDQQYYFYSRYWSYIPEGLYKELGEDIIGFSTAKILIKLESGADSKVITDQIRELINKARAGSVSSVSEQLIERQSSFSFMGPLNILRLGVMFIVLAASVGTGLVTLVSLRERRREASIMSIRGLSFKQLLIMLLTENLAVVAFAVLLGAAVGLIWVRGTIASANAFTVYSYSPINRRMVFPSDALLTLVISFTLVFASTIIPVIFMAKLYSSRLERTVREV